MLQNYIRQLLVFAFILVSFNALGQSFGTSVSARYGDGCRLDFYNTNNVKIFSLRGSELRYWYNPSGQIIVRDENTQVTDLFGITGLAALIDSVQSVCLAGLCSGSTPIETFAYCGAPLWDFWSSIDSGNDSDTLALCGGSAPLCISTNEAILHFWNSGVSFATYNYGGCLGGIICTDEIDLCLSENQTECAEIISFTTLVGGQTFTSLDSTTACESGLRAPQSISYTFDAALNDTLELNAVSFTIVADTTIKNDIFIAQSTSALRILGVVYTDIDLNTTNATIEITAKPVKTSGTTYEASSFKIEKITFADISAGTISGSTYDPNLGGQSNTFSLTTGKNTFKVSVEDTDGNVAYSIFQVTKTAL